MYCTGKIVTGIFSGVCICFTKDLQSVFLSFKGIRTGDILCKEVFNNTTLLLMNWIPTE